ncbi:MAG: GNAT family N-acetyltransferase [Lachnospiraceae bacterium]|nr:GNAT family N-acetyltransferase [Lachnospiraceae bacterium]
MDEQAGSAETSYLLAPHHWGKGLMTETVRSVLRYAFEELELNRVCADVFVGNTASEKVLKKCGFQCEGVIKEKYEKEGICIDAISYGIHKS